MYAAVCIQLCLNVCASTVEKEIRKSTESVQRKLQKHHLWGNSGSPEGEAGRQAGRLCEVSTQRERTRDRLLATSSWPPFLELTAHTGVGLRWAREEETWQAGRAEEEEEEVRAGSWVAERERERDRERE